MAYVARAQGYFAAMASAGRKRTRFQAKVDEALDTAIGPRIFYNVRPSAFAVQSDLQKILNFWRLQNLYGDPLFVPWSDGYGTAGATAHTGGPLVLGEVTHLINRDYVITPAQNLLNNSNQASRFWLEYVEITGLLRLKGQTEPDSKGAGEERFGVFDLVFELWKKNGYDPDFNKGLGVAAVHDTISGDLADNFGYAPDATQTQCPPYFLFGNFKFGDQLGSHEFSRVAYNHLPIRTFVRNQVSTQNETIPPAPESSTASGAAMVNTQAIYTQQVNIVFPVHQWVEFPIGPSGEPAENPAGLAMHPMWITARCNSKSDLCYFDPESTFVRIKYHEAVNRKVT